VSEREIAQRVYEESRRKKSSTFDAIGEFHKYYNNQPTPKSLAIPLDVGKYIPDDKRNEFLSTINPTTRQFNPNSQYFDAVTKQMLPAKAEEPSFWQKVSEGLERTWNVVSNGISFGLLLGEQNNPLYKGQWDLERIRNSWKAAGEISPGRAGVRALPATSLVGLIEKLPIDIRDFGKGPDYDDKGFIASHLLALSSDLDIYEQSQREEAFREQLFGRVSSWSMDFLARWFADPAVIVGKGIKTVNAARYAVKSLDEFKTILASDVADLGRKGQRIKKRFQNFLDETDDMAEQNLYRIKAIRESSDPAALVDLLATANKIDDKLARDIAKTDLILMAQGDADAYVRLANQSDVLAAKVGTLLTEVPDATFIAGKVGPGKQAMFDFYNGGSEYERATTLLKETEEQIENIYKNLRGNAVLDPNKVPFIDAGSRLRNAMVGDQSFIDLRSGFVGPAVRFHTGFFYKRPRGWVDFTDNTSVQTVDNQLSRIRGLSEFQETRYKKNIDALNARLASATDDADKAAIQREIKAEMAYMAKATFTTERRNALFQRYINETTPEGRAAAHEMIEAELFSTVGRQFGYSAEQIKQAYNYFTTKRQKMTNLIKERSYSGATRKLPDGTEVPVGAKVRPVIDEDGMYHVFALPINETQLLKQKPVLDIDTMYKVLQRYHRAESLGPDSIGYNLYSGWRAGGAGIGSMVDALDDFLKFQVLARLGYPIRSTTEGNMRVLSVGGGAVLLAAAVAGSKNLATKFFNRATGKNNAAEALDLAERSRLELVRMELALRRDVADNPEEIDAQIASIDNALKGVIKNDPKFGVGEIEMHGVKIQDAFGMDPETAAFINDKFIASASRAVDAHFQSARNTISNTVQMTGDWVTIKGTDANWVDSYLRAVNQQVRKSKISSKLLPQTGSREELTNYLTRKQEGYEIAKRMRKSTGKNVEEIVEENIANVNHLLPTAAMREIASKRNITADDVKKFFSDPLTRPDVNGAQIAAATELNPVSRVSNYIANRFYHLAGEMPENVLVKSPLFVDLYRRRMGALVQRAIETTKGDAIDPRYLRNLEGKARQWARSEMRRTVYDVSEKTDAAFTLKYIFPFFGAWSDVVEKWGRIIVNDPSVLRRLNMVYESPDRQGITEERDGITYINLPGEWTKRMGIDRTLSIPKPSLNLIFQGGAWWNPGAGWFVQFAASNLLQKYPDRENDKLIKEILPYGATDRNWQDLVFQSSAVRRAYSYFSENDPARARLTAQIAAEEWTRYDLGQRTDEPTKKEINDKARRVIALGVVTAMTAPAAISYRSPFQFYIDEFRKMREENPDTAAERFYDKYGDDYYALTVSLSRNNTGISATVSAWQRSQQLSDLIAKNPEYGWFYVGDANQGEFSPTVYGNQYETPVAPGSTITMRGIADPYTALSDAQVEKGWISYRKGMAILEAQRIEGGFKSINSRGAEYIKERKEAFVAALSKNNPAWAKEFGQIDTNRVNNFLTIAAEAVNDSRLKDRQDISTLKKYLQGRDLIRRELANRESQSITAQGNEDLRERWDSFVGVLLDKDVTFERIYTRILEKDDLRKGIG